MDATPVRRSRARIAVKAALKAGLALPGAALPPRRGLRVLFYHRVNAHDFAALGPVSREVTTPADAFARQMAHLAATGWRSLTLAQAEAIVVGVAPPDPRAILITFDDGYADNLEVAAPILERHGLRATVFAVSARLGRESGEIWPLGDPPGLGRLMTAAALRDWRARGHEVGAHSRTHPDLTRLSAAALAEELDGARAELQDLLGCPVTALAYPGGDVSPAVAAAAQRAGYRLGFTTQAGLSPAGADPLTLRRTEVSASDTDAIFRHKLAGRLDWTGLREGPLWRGAMRGLNHGFGRLVAGGAAAPGRAP